MTRGTHSPARSRVGTLPLLVRTAVTDVSLTVLIAVLTLLVAVGCGLVPRALAALGSADLRQAVDGLAGTRIDATGVVAPFLSGPAPAAQAAQYPDPTFGRVQAALGKAKAQASAPLRAVLGTAQVVARTAPQGALPTKPLDDKGRQYLIALVADPGYARQVRLTTGALPAAWIPPADTPLTSAASTPPIDLAVSAQTAKTLNLTVGDVFSTVVSGLAVHVRVSGVFDPVAPRSDYWQFVPSVVSPVFSESANGPPVYTATGFVNPQTAAALAGAFSGSFWFPIDSRAITTANAQGVAAGIDGLQATQIPIPAAEPGETVRVPVQTDLADAIAESSGRLAATLALVAMLASGPAGVIIAVFALGVRAVLERRGPVLALAAARGTSPAQLRGAAALEGLVAGIPAGVVGAIAAALLLPAAGADAGTRAAAWLLPLLAGLVPAMLFAALGAGRGFRTTRRDLSARARGGVRWVAEACIVGAAAVATWLLVRRGPLPGAGFDPLLALTPLLLAVAVSLIVLRLLPLVLRAALVAAHRGRGAIAFVGSARAMRDPSLGVAAALAVVVGVSVAVLSSGVLATVQAGAHAQALAQTGADIRADQDVFDSHAVTAIRRAPGVAHVAGMMVGSNQDLGLNGRDTTVQPIFADSAELHAVRPEIAGTLARRVDGRVPIIVSADLTDDHPVGAEQTLGTLPVKIVGELPEDAQLGADSQWVLVDKGFIGQLDYRDYLPTQLLIALHPGASAAPASAAITKAVPGAAVHEAQAAVAATDAVPATAGIRLALAAGVIASALLAAVAVFAGSVTAAAARNRTIAMLRTMGLTGGQSLGLVVWEIVPVVVLSGAVGLGLGLVLPRLLVATTDLAPFTGGATRLAIEIDWGQLGAILAGLAAVTALATLVAVLVARRTDPAGTVKMGAE